MITLPFEKFNKIPRLSRDIIITEKIDGTNAQIYIASFQTLNSELSSDSYNEFFKKHTLAKIRKDGKTYYIFAGSRKRWLDCSSKGDNHGFAKWVKENANELLKLGEGRHYGEWWGKGIQRGYNIDEKRFSLFNVGKWADIEVKPKCCSVVPVLYKGLFDTKMINWTIDNLKITGSIVSPGFKNPEGLVIFHTASSQLFKKTIFKDEKPKNL